MRRIPAAILVCFAVMASRAEEYRLFKDTEGRTIEARIESYDSVKGRLRIERSDGKKAWVTPDIFSEEDQRYIEQWIAADLVLSDNNIRISFKKASLGDFGSKEELKEGENICFEVTFRNRSNITIEGLRVEYRYYVSQVGSGRNPDSERKVPGSIKLDAIQARETLRIQTASLALTTVWSETTEMAGWDYNGRALYNKSMVKQREDELEGIWIRIYGPSVDGVPSYRDVSYPTDLKDKKNW